MDFITPMRTFVHVSEAGSFAAAADVLDMSPQLVGKHVSALEGRLGVKLLNRTTRRQSLTEFGEAFLERARSILEELEDAGRLAEAARGKPVGRLRISAPNCFGTHTLSPLLTVFMKAYPEVTVELTLTNQILNVVESGFDIVFRVGDLADSSLIGRKLGPYPLVLCASPGYLEKSEMISHPRDLARHECLGFSHSALKTRWTFHGPDGEPVVIPVTSKLMVNQSEPLLIACLAGFGLMMQPLELVRNHLRDGTLIEVLPDYPCVSSQISVLYPADRRITPKLRVFLDFCAEKFNETTLALR